MTISTETFDLSDWATLADIRDANEPIRVTPDSLWTDRSWLLPGWVPGYTPSAFVISFDVVADPLVVDELKWLTALLFIGRHGEKVYHPSTASVYSVGIRHLARFMRERNYGSFSRLDRHAFEEFVDDIHVKLVDPGEEARASVEETAVDEDGLLRADGVEAIGRDLDDPDASGGVAKAYNRLRVWQLLWDNRHVMAEAGIRSPRYDPFAKTSATAMARSLATVAANEIPALPDEVALPILAGAQRLIEGPADDVVELQRRYLEATRMTDRKTEAHRRAALRRILEGFEFRRLDGEKRPWHDPIIPGLHDAGAGEALRGLIRTVRDACMAVIMGYTGLRISEAVSPVVEPRAFPSDELPSCVTVETSKSGLSDHYMLHGLLSKGQGRPTPETWLIGARPKLGAGREPPAVRAIRVLEALYDPWRRSAADPDVRRQLLVGFVGSGLPRAATSVVVASAITLRIGLRALAADARYVDLSGLAAAAAADELLAPYLATDDAPVCAGIQLHQWRKTYMRYAMRTDPKMAPAISQHFKHMTVANTERDYGAKDLRMLEEADGVRARETGSFLRRMVEGKARPVARLDKAFEIAADQWEALIPDGSPRDDEAFTKVAIREDLRIWFAEHGRCLVALQPGEARCHQRAGTDGWRHARPNLLTRTPSTCAGCANFSIHEDSAGFWRRRYVQNRRAYDQSGGALDFEIIRRRAEQAAAYLKALGEPLPDVALDGEAHP